MITAAEQLSDLQRENETLKAENERLLSRYRGLEDATDENLGFFSMVLARLQKGAKEYGDMSFERTLVDLGGETLEELDDVAGYAYIGHIKIMRLMPLFRRLDAIIRRAERTGLSEEELARGMRDV